MLNYFNPPCRIYVIASDHLFSASIQKKAEKSKYQFFCYETGEAFFQDVLYSSTPNKILSFVVIDYKIISRHHVDIKDGLSVLEEVVAQQPNWTVISVSSPEDKFVKNEALKKGAFSHVFKNDNAFARIDSVIKQKVSAEKMRRNKQFALFISIVFLFFLLVAAIVFMFAMFSEA